MTIPKPGESLQPFCGALINTSTPSLSISTQTAPEAIQSKTNIPPCACTASLTSLMYSSGNIMPEAVSTCGAKTKYGF